MRDSELNGLLLVVVIVGLVDLLDSLEWKSVCVEMEFEINLREIEIRVWCYNMCVFWWMLRLMVKSVMGCFWCGCVCLKVLSSNGIVIFILVIVLYKWNFR